MTIAECKRIFKVCNAEFIKEHKDDVIMLNLEWTCFLDGLQRSGQITMKQFNNAGNLFHKRKTRN